MAAPTGAAHEPDEVPIELVQVGDLVEVRSGELVPVDGEIVEGIGSLDRAPLTGESIPVRVTVGDEIEAGLVLRRGPVVMRTSAVGDQTRLSGLIDKVHTFRDTTPRLQGAVELFTLIFACSRISGWTAHLLEQYADNRLIRPVGEYIGTTNESYVPIENRN